MIIIELAGKQNYNDLMQNMAQYNINYTELNKNNNLFEYLV